MQPWRVQETNFNNTNKNLNNPKILKGSVNIWKVVQISFGNINLIETWNFISILRQQNGWSFSSRICSTFSFCGAEGLCSCLSVLGGCRRSEDLPASRPRLRIIAQQNTMKSVNLLLHLLYHQHLSGIETVPDFRERGRKDGPHKNMRRTRVPVMLQLYTQQWVRRVDL